MEDWTDEGAEKGISGMGIGPGASWGLDGGQAGGQTRLEESRMGSDREWMGGRTGSD